MKFRIVTIAAMLAGTPASAQPYYPPVLRELPPVTVYAVPPPPPPVAIGQGLGEVIGGAVALPFQLLNGFFSAFVPPVPLVPDGMGGLVPAYVPVYAPPVYVPPPYEPTYAPPARREGRHPEPGVYARPESRPEPSFGCYDGHGRWVGDANQACGR